MKLTDFKPRWYVNYEGGPRAGFTFMCPCRDGCPVRIGVAVTEEGLIDPDPDDARCMPPGAIWKVQNLDDFSKISIEPSVDASKSGHWHGHITNGECISQ